MFPRIATLITTALAVAATNVHGQGIPDDCVSGGNYAITVDAGPGPLTGALLDILDTAQAKITFHFSTDYFNQAGVKANARLAVTDGHEIGLRLSAIPDGASTEEIKSSIQAQIAIMYSTIGVSPNFVRAPTDALGNANLMAAIGELGLTLTGFNLDSTDYAASNGAAVFNVIKTKLDQIASRALGSFIAVHTETNASVTAMADVITLVRERGYTLVKMGECLNIASTLAPPTGVAPPSDFNGPSAPTGSLNAASVKSYSVATLVAASVLALACLL